MGNFNLESSYMLLSRFMDSHNYLNLIKGNTYFKSQVLYIDLILTNKKNYFKNAASFKTGLSDHHHLIYSMLKTAYQREREESK